MSLCTRLCMCALAVVFACVSAPDSVCARAPGQVVLCLCSCATLCVSVYVCVFAHVCVFVSARACVCPCVSSSDCVLVSVRSLGCVCVPVRECLLVCACSRAFHCFLVCLSVFSRALGARAHVCVCGKCARARLYFVCVCVCVRELLCVYVCARLRLCGSARMLLFECAHAVLCVRSRVCSCV